MGWPPGSGGGREGPASRPCRSFVWPALYQSRAEGEEEVAGGGVADRWYPMRALKPPAAREDKHLRFGIAGMDAGVVTLVEVAAVGRPGIFAKRPLVWIVVNSRDPN